MGAITVRIRVSIDVISFLAGWQLHVKRVTNIGVVVSVRIRFRIKIAVLNKNPVYMAIISTWV